MSYIETRRVIQLKLFSFIISNSNTPINSSGFLSSISLVLISPSQVISYTSDRHQQQLFDTNSNFFEAVRQILIVSYCQSSDPAFLISYLLFSNTRKTYHNGSWRLQLSVPFSYLQRTSAIPLHCNGTSKKQEQQQNTIQQHILIQHHYHDFSGRRQRVSSTAYQIVFDNH